MRSPRRPTGLLLVCGVLLVGLAVGLLLWWRPLLVNVGEWLVVETPERTADLVVALGGDRTRQDAAVELLNRGSARWILFVGADIRPHDYQCLNVPPDRVLPQPGPAHTTIEEAWAAREVAQKHRVRSVVIVTSPYHLRRAFWTFQRVFRDTDVALRTSAAPNQGFSANDWWKTHFGRKMVLSEYFAFAYYWFIV